MERNEGGRTMKRMTKILANVLLLNLVQVGPLAGQELTVGVPVCDLGVVEGSIGISGLDCVGECTVTLREDGTEDRWVFTTEPRIFSVEEGGPSEGIFQPGDRLVAIDGILITTREGGRRYANLEPGEVVTVRYRRDGMIREAGIRVGGRCQPTPTGAVVVSGRVAPPPLPPEPDRAEPLRGVATAPRVRVIPETAVEAPAPPEPRLAGALSSLSLLGSRPRGLLGIGFACEHCGTQTDEETGESLWFFSGPLEVTAVNKGGAAEEAGIRLGDFIKAIDGHDIATEEGGLAFSSLVPGEAVRVTLVRRNGREEDVTLVPGEASGYGLARPVTPPARPEEPAAPTPALGRAVPMVPDRAEVLEPGRSFLAGPEELPLSYSGTVAGVEVVVRGGPVSVSELQGARTLIINADGIWVRIRVPAGVGGGRRSPR
jgi:membrane-associated protease RseP (regulator of RpoE activity)